jgi:hypothetical protein
VLAFDNNMRDVFGGWVNDDAACLAEVTVCALNVYINWDVHHVLTSFCILLIQLLLLAACSGAYQIQYKNQHAQQRDPEHSQQESPAVTIKPAASFAPALPLLSHGKAYQQGGNKREYQKWV